jgi:CBS domain-containing protein
MASSNSPSIVLDAAVDFLRTIPPFQFLSVPELKVLVKSMSQEYFPKDTLILGAGGEAADSLYVVKKGGVKLSIGTGEGTEVILDVRSEGELFGLLSMLGGDVTRLDVTAVEDTICYSIPGDQVRKHLLSHPEAAGYLVRTSVTRYIDRSLAEIRERTRMLGDGERLLYSLSVADVAKRPAFLCNPETTIRAAAQLMAATGSTSVFVADSSKRATGVVTDNDFADKVVACARPLDAPVTEIMSSPVIGVEATGPLFYAMVQMLSHNIHHLLVTRSGVAESVLTNHDLLLLQGKSPLTLIRHVGQQSNMDELVAAQARTSELIPLLMREGAKPSHVTRIVAELNDRVVAKILELGEKELGPPPAPYCWVVMGSEGRQEQTFKTDQDNGLIYDDVSGSEARTTEKYFEGLAKFASTALERCGYPPCEGGFMAANPRWRQPLTAWKNNFGMWITDPVQKTVEDAFILFDMRAVAGNPHLYDELWRHIRGLLSSANLFKSMFAFVSVNHKPPLGFFRQLVVERSGQHKNELDLKLKGTGPIVNAARIWSLEAGIEEINTVDRLQALERAGTVEGKLLADLREGLEFLTSLRLEHQLQQAKSGTPISNYINPASLSPLQKGLLKEAFGAITRAQTLIKAKFETWVWTQLR